MFFLKFSIWVLLICSFGKGALSDASELDDIDPNELTFGNLFVSLGSNCHSAHMMRYCEVRKVAFPFDWIISFDGEALIQILEEDFKDFLNEEYFAVYDMGGALLHTKYHLEFLHEGDWRGEQYYANLQQLKSKYQRRIERFRQLRNYHGKVFFVRNAFQYSNSDPHRFFKNDENLEITDEYSIRLNAALKKFFPKLKFNLIIMNLSNEGEVKEEKKIEDNLFMFRFNQTLEQPFMIDAFKKFFNNLNP